MAVDPQHSQFLTLCDQAARAAGEVLRRWEGKFKVREKGRADLVTEADLEAQNAIYDILMGPYPDFGFLGEEEGHSTRSPGDNPWHWIVDPLDGTTNYVHGLQNYCVSIALAEGDRIVAGVVYDPVFDRSYQAVTGGGAFMNGERLQASGAETLEQSLVAASFAPSVTRDSQEIDDFVNVMVRSQGIRRLGSAALNLAFVAAGQLDAYWAGDIKPWDIAAGVLLVEEAGGLVRNYGNVPIDWTRPQIVATATEPLQAEMQGILSPSY
ncbi:MAG: inositol monophosphatase family protein [Pirellulaceae bacterium]